MRLIAGVVSFAFLAAGCATTGYVDKKVAPLEERMAAFEKGQAAQDAKIEQQAQELAALRKGMSDQSAASAARAEQAAKEAAAAADRAESAAQKSTKAFELGQVKGAAKK